MENLEPIIKPEFFKLSANSLYTLQRMNKHISYQIKFLLCLISTIFFVSCHNNSETAEKTDNQTNTDSDSCSTFLNAAKSTDAVLLKALEVNQQVAENAIAVFYKFALHCKTDSLSPVFLLKAGQVAQSINNFAKAKMCFEKSASEFPKFSNRGAALFLLAQLYDNQNMLNNESEARIIYEQIIKEYPSSPFANDSKAALTNLGKSDEELVQEFLKKNK